LRIQINETLQNWILDIVMLPYEKENNFSCMISVICSEHHQLNFDASANKNYLVLHGYESIADKNVKKPATFFIRWTTRVHEVDSSILKPLKSYNIANGSPPFQHLHKQLWCLGAASRKWSPQTRYTLRRNIASVMKS